MEYLDRSLTVFEEAIRSEQTRKQYRYHLDKFVEFANKEYPEVRKASDLLQLNDNYLQEQLEDYLIFCKKRVGNSTIKVRFSALELYFSMNDRVLNFKKIRKMYPVKKKVLGGHPWTTEEIKSMLQTTRSLRNKAVIHFLASTGCRIGALEDLKLKCISDMGENCKSVLIYEGSTEEYHGFLTPEASKVLEDYFAERSKHGEYLNPNSPVFRREYRKQGIAKAESVDIQTLRTTLNDTIFNKIRPTKSENMRHDTPMFHGFRIRFNTILKNNTGVNPNRAERLMGHFSKTIPLDTCYFKPYLDDLFNEFRKVIPDLTIDDSGRLKEKNQKLEAEKSELVKANEMLKDSLKKVDELWADKQRMESRHKIP
jgi:integrase/recombinase XerD